MRIVENIEVYGNTFVFISFALLTTDVFKIENPQNRHFSTTRVEFTSILNELRFSIYIDDEKIIFLIVGFRMIKRQRRLKSIKM